MRPYPASDDKMGGRRIQHSVGWMLCCASILLPEHKRFELLLDVQFSVTSKSVPDLACEALRGAPRHISAKLEDLGEVVVCNVMIDARQECAS